VWPHSYSSQEQSSLASDGEHWAGPAVVPSLVLELARSLLKNLLEEAFQDSSEWEAVEEEAPASWEVHVEDGVGRLSQTQTSVSPSQLPTPSPRKQLRTSSSSESGQARNSLGQFGSKPV